MGGYRESAILPDTTADLPATLLEDAAFGRSLDRDPAQTIIGDGRAVAGVGADIPRTVECDGHLARIQSCRRRHARAVGGKACLAHPAAGNGQLGRAKRGRG